MYGLSADIFGVVFTVKTSFSASVSLLRRPLARVTIKVLSASGTFVLPSLIEGLPGALIQALILNKNMAASILLAFQKVAPRKLFC